MFQFSGRFGGRVDLIPCFTASGFSLSVSVLFFRWLDRNEDDGQIVRELVPDRDGLRLFSECMKNILNQE